MKKRKDSAVMVSRNSGPLYLKDLSSYTLSKILKKRNTQRKRRELLFTVLFHFMMVSALK